jgi:RNA polymerase sigma-70 factor (ECF subfamily)
MPDVSEEESLWEGLLSGRPEALTETYRRHGRKTFQVAYGILRRAELAEDVTQDVFVRLWQRPERFDPNRGTLGGFLKLDAHGRSLDLARAERARTDREIRDQRLSEASDSPSSLEEKVMKRISSERIRGALLLLQPEERLPIVLAFFQGLSYRRVAEALDMPEGTVKSRIRRGLVRLRGLLGEEAPALG